MIDKSDLNRPTVIPCPRCDGTGHYHPRAAPTVLINCDECNAECRPLRPAAKKRP